MYVAYVLQYKRPKFDIPASYLLGYTCRAASRDRRVGPPARARSFHSARLAKVPSDDLLRGTVPTLLQYSISCFIHKRCNQYRLRIYVCIRETVGVFFSSSASLLPHSPPLPLNMIDPVHRARDGLVDTFRSQGWLASGAALRPRVVS